MVGRPSNADAQRQRVLAASAAMFSRRGYRATTMNEIAAEVGLSKPTLYHYFRRKEDILVALYEGVMAESVASAEAILASAAGPLDAFRQLIADRVRYTCENRALLKVFFEEEDELPSELLATVVDQRRQFEDICKSVVAEHLAATGRRLQTSPTVYINACLGAANWAYKWFDARGQEDPRTLGDHIATIMLQPLL